MSDLAYKANAGEVIERLRSLYERSAPDRIFATFSVPGAGREALAAFRKTHTEGPCDYPDPADRIEFWDRLLRETTSVEDDSLRYAYLTEMDQGLYGGLLGGDVRFNCNPHTGWISSMVPPLLKGWSEFDRLRFSRSHPWFDRYLAQLRVFAEGARDKFGVCPFVLINGLNFVFELVGATETYTSLLDSPDAVRKAMELGFDVNAAVQDAFFEKVPLFHGGTFSLGCQWIPGRIVMESVDPFHMTSVAYFEEWGRVPLERMFARYDGGEVHLHGNGRHLLEAVSSVKGLKAIQLGDDTGFPKAFEVLRELRARSGDLPLVVGVGFRDFAKTLERHELPGGVLYKVGGAPGADAANQCMEKVRAYRV
jgi:hypothetical protein